VNEHQALAFIDTGNELPTCVSERFVKEHDITTYELKEPMEVDLAGTVAFQTPISHEYKTETIKAIVFPTTRHDVIIGMRDIIKHMIPLNHGTANQRNAPCGHDKGDIGTSGGSLLNMRT
jgi:hypothetical protein